MNLIALFLLLTQFSIAELTIDPRYDNYDGEALVLKLIEDNQWPAAQQVFEKDQNVFQNRSPADYYLIKGLFSQHQGSADSAANQLEKSLSLRYSPLAIEKIMVIYNDKRRFTDGLSLLENHQKSILGKNLNAELIFLKSLASQKKELSRVFTWTEKYLSHYFSFPLFKFYVETLIKNKLLNESLRAAEIALAQNKLKSAEEVLTLVELFLVDGYDKDVHGLLEHARLRYPGSDLIKLNLAQVLFKKDLHFSALNLLSELKTDDGVVNVQLELMNLMQVKTYSLFHRMHVQDSQSHLKNWFVYLINNENWASLYALSSKYAQSSWKSDEFNYAMAYSAQLVNDPHVARTYIEQVKSPSLSQKKDNLIKSLNL